MPKDHELLTPKEHELPSVWREGFTYLREHEIGDRWIGERPGRTLEEFNHWRESKPTEYQAWAAEHAAPEILEAREVTLTDRLSALDLARAEAEAHGAGPREVFAEPGASTLFHDLQRGEWAEPAVVYPGQGSMAVEVRTSAADLGKFTERISDLAGKSLVDTYVEFVRPQDADYWRVVAEEKFEPIREQFDKLGDALKSWNELTSSAAEPKAADLEKAAREIRDRIEACKKAIPDGGLVLLCYKLLMPIEMVPRAVS